jgi:IPT/TIG domain-containing protein/PASTA domain-containing protein
MRLIKSSLMLCAVILMGAATAQAAPITVGSPLTGTFTPATYGGVGTIANVSVPEAGAHVTSPVSGAVIAWNVVDASGGPFAIRVLRPAGGSYLGVSSSAPAFPTGAGMQTFATALPIQAGDIVGLDNGAKTDKIGVVVVPGAAFAIWVPPLANGSSRSPDETTSGGEVGFNAVIQPSPTLTAVSPASGSIKGGTSVTITGTDFASVSGVSFGGAAAKSFTVANEGQLTAVAPKGKVGKVDVTVTTVAGTTPFVAADKFKYKACVVPKLEGKTLKAAKKKLRKAGCKVGKVKLRGDATSKTGKVVKQSPRPGRQYAPGTKVNVTLG